MEMQRVVNGLVSLEVRHRQDAFKAATEALSEQIKQWSQPGAFVVPDTSFYMRHDKLEEADFAPLVKVWEDPIHVLVPIVIVDELDNLKQSRDKHLRRGLAIPSPCSTECSRAPRMRSFERRTSPPLERVAFREEE